MTTPTMADAKPQPPSPLANRNFRWLWLGQAISQIGDGLTNLALLIVINQLTGSTAALATMTIAIALPQLLFGLLAGVFVDRWDRKRIMIVSDVVRGLLVLGLIVVRRPEDVWVFYILGFLQAAVGTFFDPAKSALIPSIVEKEGLLAANGLSQMTRVFASVIGSACAGILVSMTGGAWPAFTFDALSFFVSALFIMRVVSPAQTVAPVAGGITSVFGQLTEGLKYLASQRLLLGVLVVFAVTMLGMGAVNVLFVPFLLNALKVPIEVLGGVEFAQVLGMIVGSTVISGLAARLKPTTLIIGGVLLMGIVIAGVGAADNIWFVLIGLFLVGLCLTPVQAAASTIMQQHVPNDKRGRVMSALNTVITLASVISMACAGLLGDAIGVRQVFYFAGVIVASAGLIAALLIGTPQVQPAPLPATE